MQSFNSIMMMILAAQPPVDMLKSKQMLMRSLAEEGADLTPAQRQKVIMRRLSAIVFSRFLRNRRGHNPLRMNPDVRRYLMTMGIPRNMRIKPLRISQPPDMQSCCVNPGSVFLHPSGHICNNGWSQYSASIEAITTDPRHQLTALISSDGKVWIGEIGDPKNLFRLIHDPKSKENERATTCAFHPFGYHIVVAITGYLLIYSTSGDFQLSQRVGYYQEPGYFCTLPPQFSACELQWHPSGFFLTAISHCGVGLSKSFVVDPMTLTVKSETRHGYLSSLIKGHVPPLSSCFSPDGKFVATSHPSGNLMLETVVGPDFNCLEVTRDLFPGRSMKNIDFSPTIPSILAIQTSFMGCDEVHLLRISPDGSVKILQTIPNVTGFHFYKKWFLVSSGNRITFYRMNGDNIVVKMTEFQSENGQIGPFTLTTVRDKVTVWYSIALGYSKVHKLKITFE